MAKQYVNKWMERDEDAFKMMYRCGTCSDEQLNEFVKDKRLGNYARDGYTEKVEYKNFEKSQSGYKLTKKGREHCEREYGVINAQHAQSLNHDHGIAEKYLSVDKETRESWKTETDLQEKFKEYVDTLDKDEQERIREMQEQGEVSTPDAYYVTKEGVEICYEVVTSSYGAAEIEAKIEFCEIMEIEYEEGRR